MESAAMTEAALNRRVYELLQLITSSRGTDQPAAKPDGLYISHHSREKEACDQMLDLLRLQVKYLLFDLEATRRENRYLRQMLDTRPPHNQEKKGDEGLKDF